MAGPVRARERFLATGHFAPLASKLADLAVEQAAETPGCVIDAGVGTGYYLAAVLERLPDRVGLGLDVSKYALRRAARAHDRAGAVGCDIWQGLPVATGVAAVVLNVFAPRNAAELARVLRPSGRLLVVTPSGAHLAELVAALDLVTVDEHKSRRLADQLDPYFELMDRQAVTATMSLSHDEVEAVVGMGPSAWHADPDATAERVRLLPEPVAVTLSVAIGVYRRSP